MKDNKGSISYILLICLIYITFFAQITLQHLKSDYERTRVYAQNLQLRTLCNSVFQWLEKQPKNVNKIQLQYYLSPNLRPLDIKGEFQISDDNMFESYSVQVDFGSKQQVQSRLVFSPSEQLKELGNQFMFTSRYGYTGANYLSKDKLYTSNGSLQMPMISFLSGKAHNTLDMSYVHENGFANSFSYLPSKTTLSYSGTAPITKGSELIASKGEIIIQKNFKATDRLIIISNSNITLEDNVSLSNVLIIAKGKINIGNTCKLTGVVISGNNITFQGSGTFIHDASVVADYASAIFIA